MVVDNQMGESGTPGTVHPAGVVVLPLVPGFLIWFSGYIISRIFTKKAEKAKSTVHSLLPRAPLMVSAAPGGRLSLPTMWGRMLRIVSCPSGVPANFCNIAVPSGEVKYFLTTFRPSGVSTYLSISQCSPPISPKFTLASPQHFLCLYILPAAR